MWDIPWGTVYARVAMPSTWPTRISAPTPRCWKGAILKAIRSFSYGSRTRLATAASRSAAANRLCGKRLRNANSDMPLSPIPSTKWNPTLKRVRAVYGIITMPSGSAWRLLRRDRLNASKTVDCYVVSIARRWMKRSIFSSGRATPYIIARGARTTCCPWMCKKRSRPNSDLSPMRKNSR